MKITIAGYGSVGSYVAGLFSDLDPTLYDPPLGLGTAHDLRDADFVIVCVPTPSLPSGACDTSIVEEVVRLADPRAAIVCHSTVAIGTTERLIAETGKPIVFVPEYAGEADAHPLRDPRNRRFLIYGGYEPAASEVQALYERAYGPGLRHFRVPPTVAEVVKYMENAFLAAKVAFCNEFFDLCEAVGVDYDWARLLWLQDERINPSHTVVTRSAATAGNACPRTSPPSAPAPETSGRRWRSSRRCRRRTGGTGCGVRAPQQPRWPPQWGYRADDRPAHEDREHAALRLRAAHVAGVARMRGSTWRCASTPTSLAGSRRTTPASRDCSGASATSCKASARNRAR